MGTRACIAETHEGSWRGRYHHWDGYPTALGKTLWDVYHGHFGRNITTMLQFLIHDHPAGWSTINGADWNMQAGYVGMDSVETNQGPQCYCHGTRHEGAEPPLGPEDDAGLEWCYVIDAVARTMTVLKHVWQSDEVPYIGIGCMTAKEPLKWKEVAVVSLDGEEPKWEEMES